MTNAINWVESPKEDEKKKLKQLEKGKKAIEKRKRIREEKLAKQKQRDEKERIKREDELRAIHNGEERPKEELSKREKMVEKINKQNLKKLRKKRQEEKIALPQVGMSRENKKWEQKRINKYNARVWKGWRESE
ncbi:hypothetical protein bcgnr5390_11140 [Bacillus luti]|nr:hypothetical protein BC2903_29770 [Bacillus cereus]